MLLLLYCIEIISVAPIIGSVIGKTIYWLCFLYTTMMKKAADTDTYMYIFRNTSSCAPNNVYKCIKLHFLHYNVVITASVYCQLL